MYINGIVLGVLATVFVEMAVVIGVAIAYSIYESKHSHRSRRG
jgi:hypothetical protein